MCGRGAQGKKGDRRGGRGREGTPVLVVAEVGVPTLVRGGYLPWMVGEWLHSLAGG